MSFRCESQRLIPRAAIERFQEWIYHTDHPIEALLMDNYFAPVGERFFTGDIIDSYAVGLTRVRFLKLHVVEAGHQSVVVAPFSSSHDVNDAAIQSAVGFAGRLRDQGSRGRYELQHLNYGDYRIVDCSGDVVVGGIRGHELGVTVLGEIITGKLSLTDARRVIEKATLDTHQQDSQKVDR